MTTKTYRCPGCNTNVSIPADDDMPVCNNTDACGFLFDYDEVTVQAPHKSTVKFSLVGEGHLEGDDREYEVIIKGRCVGYVSAEQRPSAIYDPTESTFVDGFGFGGNIEGVRRYGWGRTRYAAIADAFNV